MPQNRLSQRSALAKKKTASRWRILPSLLHLQGDGKLPSTTLRTWLLFLLFVSYYVILIVISIQLIAWLQLLLVPVATSPHGGWLFAGAATGVFVLLLRLVAECINGMVGLVTSKLDRPDLSGLQMVDSATAPALYQLVMEVGEQAGKILPDEIQISPRPECYVAEQRQWALWTKRQLTLVIGAPHLAVLSCGELKVIVAHELNHFSDGDTRLGVFLQRFLLSLHRSDSPLQLLWLWYWDPIRPMRWIGLILAQRIAAPLWRAQELRADMAAANAYGGRFTARTLLREWLLSRHFQQELVRRWRAAEERTTHPSASVQQLSPGNLYQQFATSFGLFGRGAEQYLYHRLANEEEQLPLETHPSMRVRFHAVLQYPDQEHVDATPARSLLPHFERWSDWLQAGLLKQATTL